MKRLIPRIIALVALIIAVPAQTPTPTPSPTATPSPPPSTTKGAVGAFYKTTTSSFSIPAPQAIAGITVGSIVDLSVGMGVLVTDGANFMNGVITAISGSTVLVENLRLPFPPFAGPRGVAGTTMGAGYLTSSGVKYILNTPGFLIPSAQDSVSIAVDWTADLWVNEDAIISDGTNFIKGVITAISGTTITIKNLGPPGAVSGSMGPGYLVRLGTPEAGTTFSYDLKPDPSAQASPLTFCLQAVFRNMDRSLEPSPAIWVYFHGKADTVTWSYTVLYNGVQVLREGGSETLSADFAKWGFAKLLMSDPQWKPATLNSGWNWCYPGPALSNNQLITQRLVFSAPIQVDWIEWPQATYNLNP
jgi:hypothetical protein